MARRTSAKSAAAVFVVAPSVDDRLTDDLPACEGLLHGSSMFINEGPQAWIAKLFHQLIAT